jgi:hypothetical protein
LQKLEQRPKNIFGFIGVCWIYPEHGHCSLFPSGSC